MTNGDCTGAGTLLGQACDSMTSAAASSMGKPGNQGGDISNDTSDNSGAVSGNSIVDNVADKIHVPDFYSLYALAVCEGNFSADGSRTLTRCHPYFSTCMPSPSPLFLPLSSALYNTNTNPRSQPTRPRSPPSSPQPSTSPSAPSTSTSPPPTSA